MNRPAYSNIESLLALALTLTLTCSSRTPALTLSLAPAAASGPIAPKPTTIVDRGQTYKPQGKHTRTSCICRCKDLARCLLLPPMLKSNTCSRLSLAPAAASGPIAPKPETTIVDRGVKPTNHKGKHTHISCRCECLARLPFIAARASSPLVTCSFASTS